MFLDRLLRRKIMHNDTAKKVMFSEEEKRFEVRKREIPGCTGEFRALFITDTHGHMTKQALDNFISDIGDVDVIFALGDMSEREQLLLKQYYADIPRYALLGNHDYYGQLEETGLPDINGKMVVINGVSFTGIYGSIKYKNTDAPMMTDEESVKVAKTLPECDILLSHDKAKKAGDEGSHAGLEGITWYLLNRQPVYHFHGHLHENMIENVANVPSIGFCRYAYISFSKEGCKVLKYFG